MNFRKRILFLIISFVYLASAFAQNSPDKDYSYAIGSRDLLAISVFDVPELNITVRVSQDGTITLPLLGQVDVDGLTAAELGRKLAALLENRYLKNAQVTVFIKEFQSRQTFVLGAVPKPGKYELIGTQTLLKVLAKAGGLTQKAGDRLIIIRQYTDGTAQTLPVNLAKLMSAGNPELNIPILPGDIINVPVEVFVDIYIFGQVNHAGQIKMKKNTGLTLLRAIAQAGGFTERARKSGVIIKRLMDAKEERIDINVNKILAGKKTDFILSPNDIVYIPESIF